MEMKTMMLQILPCEVHCRAVAHCDTSRCNTLRHTGVPVAHEQKRGRVGRVEADDEDDDYDARVAV